MEWKPERLEGRIVRLEPLGPEHEEGLWEASRDPRTWRWLSVLQPQTRAELRAYLDDALANQANGAELPFVTVRREDDRVVGSTRYLALRPEHRSLEIGWTWLTPEAWATGINVEAKLLMLEHAFERLGCLRVELKTDARNERSRGAIAALPLSSKACTGRPCSSGAASGATRPGTASSTTSGRRCARTCYAVSAAARNSLTTRIASGRSRKTPCPASG